MSPVLGACPEKPTASMTSPLHGEACEGANPVQAGLTRRHLRTSRAGKASVAAGAEEVSDSTKR
jgi:hypothetical protein